VARQRVWVLWARTWNNGNTRLLKVTRKETWQKHLAKMKERREKVRPSYEESLPTFFHESNDRDTLLKMLELAQPLSVETKEK
jgi:hypothetical protein